MTLGMMARRLVLVGVGILYLGASGLRAQDVVEFLREQQEDFVSSPPTAPWWDWDAATGDWIGTRTGLQDLGVEIFGGYNYTLQSALSRSGRTDWIYSGLLDFGVHLDLEKSIGWTGASVQTTWIWIHGNTIEESLRDDLMISSDLAGFETFRMLDLWFQQNILDDKISLRIGQFTADTEFVRSVGAGVFLNRSLGWPALLAANLPGGGPSVPLATLGARLAIHPTDWLTLQSAIFQGNVYDQITNPHGFLWNLNRDVGFFLINEIQGRWAAGDADGRLPGQVKAGFWAQTGRSANPLAGMTSSANFGGYFVLDQMLYREPVAPGMSPGGEAALPARSLQGLGWFGRMGFSPQERSLVDFYFDTGLVYTGLIPTRDADTLGLALAYGVLSSGAAKIPTFRESYGDGYQMVVELTYRAQLTPWLSIQPDLQFFLTPGSSLNHDNAVVLGGSLAIRF